MLADAYTQLGDPAAATRRDPADARPAARSGGAMPGPPTTSNSAARSAEADRPHAAGARRRRRPGRHRLLPQPAGRPRLVNRRPRRRSARVRGRLAANPGYLSLLRGRARVAAARGDLAAAVTDVGRSPLARRRRTPCWSTPTLLRLAGRSDEAAAAADAGGRAAHTLFVANGGPRRPDRCPARAGPGRRSGGRAAGPAEWQRRPFADVADVLGWSLHPAGRDAEALPLLRQAVAGSPRNAGTRTTWA